MPERSELANLIFGRLSWEAIPYHEPILLATFAVVAIWRPRSGGAADLLPRLGLSVA